MQRALYYLADPITHDLFGIVPLTQAEADHRNEILIRRHEVLRWLPESAVCCQEVA